MVSLINNFFSKEDLDYYTIPQGKMFDPLKVHLLRTKAKAISFSN